jgi:hypothetical protein
MRSSRRGIAADSSTNGLEKLFWTTSRNRLVDDPVAIGIARITRKRFAFASSRATANTIGAREDACRNAGDTTVAPTIGPRGRRFDVARGASRRPHDAAEARVDAIRRPTRRKLRRFTRQKRRCRG